MDLFDFVYKENVFSKDFCDQKLKTLEQSHWLPHRWTVNEGTWQDVDRKDFSVLHQYVIQKQMVGEIVSFVKRYGEKVSGYFHVNEFSPIRFNKYESGEGIREHVDHIYSLFDGDKKGIPVISLVGVFNDDYDGGELFLCGEKVELKTGDVLVFPSLFMYPHMVTEVTKGVRYSWVSWGY